MGVLLFAMLTGRFQPWTIEFKQSMVAVLSHWHIHCLASARLVLQTLSLLLTFCMPDVSIIIDLIFTLGSGSSLQISALESTRQLDVQSVNPTEANLLPFTGNYPFSRLSDKEMDQREASRKLFGRIMHATYEMPQHISRWTFWSIGRIRIFWNIFQYGSICRFLCSPCVVSWLKNPLLTMHGFMVKNACCQSSTCWPETVRCWTWKSESSSNLW